MKEQFQLLMLKSRKELAAGKSMIKVAISMNFLGDKKEYQGLAESKEFQHMIANMYHDYGNTGCGVFKRGIQNLKDFCLRINIPKGNF